MNKVLKDVKNLLNVKIMLNVKFLLTGKIWEKIFWFSDFLNHIRLVWQNKLAQKI